MSSSFSLAVPRTIAALVDSAALRTPTKIAVRALQQSQGAATTTGTGTTTKVATAAATTPTSYTYEELSTVTNNLAGFLSLYGYERNDVLISDLPNTVDNLLIQLACNRLGVSYGTTKSLETMSKQFTKIKGAIVNIDNNTTNNANDPTNISFLSTINLPLPYIGSDFLSEMLSNGSLNNYSGDTYDGDDSINDDNRTHGLYNTSTPYTNKQAIQHGTDAAFQLSMSSNDIVCVAVTLCHPFGIGSAICSTLYSGATIVLPSSINSIVDCGIPSQRSIATFHSLIQEKCTLLFADTHTMNVFDNGINKKLFGLTNDDTLQLVLPSDLPQLRGGVCKVGSGSTFLQPTIKFAGISMKTMGTK